MKGAYRPNRKKRASRCAATAASVFFCILGFISSLTSFASDTLETYRFFRQADSLYRSAEFDPALNYFDKASLGYYRDGIWNRYVICQNKKAEVNLRKSNLVQAEQIAQENLTFVANHFPPAGLYEASVHNILGEIQLNKGRNDLALEFLQKAQIIIFKSSQSKSALSASVYNNLGLVYWNSGNIDLALEHLLKALEIRKEIYGENNSEVAGSYNNIGLIFIESDPDKAMDYYNKALEINLKLYPEGHPALAAAYNNIVFVNRKQAKYVEALANLEKVLNIWKSVYNEEHPNVAFVFLNKGDIYAEEGKNEAALDYYKDALRIYKKNYGEKHPDLAYTFNMIGLAYQRERKYALALENFQNALCSNTPDFNTKDILKNPSGREYYNSNLLLQSLMLKAEALETQYFAKTIKLKELEMAASTLMLCDTLIDKIRQSRVNKSDKIALGNVASEVYEDGIRINLALADLTGKKKHWYSAFFFSEKSKSSVLLEAISETEAKHFANIPDVLLESERQLKVDIAYYEQKLASRPSAEEEKKYRDKLFTLNREYNDFSKDLEKKYPEYYNLKFNVHASTVEEIQKTLDGETSLISYFIADKSQRVYIFRISKKKFEVLDILKDADFDKNLKGFRNSILFKNENTFSSTGMALYKQLFPKNFNKEIKRVLIIPDGRLGTIPFEAMLMGKVKNPKDYKNLPYLIKAYGVSYVYSATLYCQTKLKASKTEGSTESIFLCAPVEFNPAYSGGVSRGLSPLLSTEKEVKDISEMFKNKGLNCQVCLRDEAKENTIKSGILKKYKFLHFATHGIVNEANPELSQVFLAADSAGKEDGNLFSGEIYNLDLNADLVTLSACQTGLGKISKGEGIIGLSRALLYAGAKNIFVSLWSVADKSTSLLMIDFYGQLLEGKGKAEALREAKLKMINTGVPEAEGSLDVFYWSPFVLIGN
jgi:CHAT domain-containing protein/Tfp pilus assembly protein PilF